MGFSRAIAFLAGVPTLMQYFQSYQNVVAKASGGIGNVYSNNTYTWSGGGPGAFSFVAGSQNRGTLTQAQWQASPYGQDAGSTFGAVTTPIILLSPGSLAFTATAGGLNPSSQNVTVSNSGAGTLASPTTTITYGSGSGWLTVTKSGSSPPYTLTAQPSISGLAAGTYTATVSVASSGATDSPQTFSVVVTVASSSSSSPAISLSPTSLGFSATAGGSNPASQNVTVSNSGGGTLAAPTTQINYSQGSGWLSVNCTGSSAPYTCSTQPTTGSLAAGTYTATVQVSSSGATNSPQSYTVAFTVNASTPTISLYPTSLTFSANVGGGNPSRRMSPSATPAAARWRLQPPRSTMAAEAAGSVCRFRAVRPPLRWSRSRLPGASRPGLTPPRLTSRVRERATRLRAIPSPSPSPRREGGGSTQVNLSSSFNIGGMYTDGTTFSSTGGMDGNGLAYSATLLGSSQTWNSVLFNLGPTNTLNAVSGTGQTITLPSGAFSTLRMLATGSAGNQLSQTITVTYTDLTTSTFTQSFSDWFTPQNYSGESEAVSVAYNDTYNGGRSNQTYHLYGYSFALNSSKTVKSVTLPNDARVGVLAMTLVAPSTPTISLSPTSLTFSATAGGSNPSSQNVTVSNSGGGTLATPTTQINYGSGSGWLSVQVQGSSAPFTLANQPSISGLAAGTYTATVSVASSGATNTPQTYSVTLTVAAVPTISLSPTSLTFSATAGGSNPASQNLTVSNSGGGTLATPTTQINYGSGSGWLSVQVQGSSAPFTLVTQPATGSLAAGTYTATVNVSSTGASNTPQSYTVTFTVSTSGGGDPRRSTCPLRTTGPACTPMAPPSPRPEETIYMAWPILQLCWARRKPGTAYSSTLARQTPRTM